jgi:AraC-like DNA-binding protein
VAAVWIREGGLSNERDARILPDGCADVIWRDDGGTVSTFVAGPDTRAHLAPIELGTRVVGVRFAPGVASDVIGIPLDELRDQRVPLEELWGQEAHDLAERVATDDRPARALVATVRDRVIEPPDPATRAIVDRVERATGRGVVARLADEVGMSSRHLQRRCLSAFGYGAKTLHEVLRFQRALRLARTGGPLAHVAATVGYADQAHLARVSRRLAGVPVSELFKP